MTEEFFEDYQRFFRIYVFDDEVDIVVNDEYIEILEFNDLIFQEESRDNRRIFGEVNNGPNWILDNEAPGEYNGKRDAVFFYSR